MANLLWISGTAVLIVLFMDVLWTTMGFGAGQLTRRFSMWLYLLLRRVCRFHSSRMLLSWIAIIVLLAIIVMWVAMLWLGWTLIFSAQDQGIVHAERLTAAGVWERIYYTGFTIVTLGMGDFAPRGGTYQVLTIIASLLGLFMITFVVTFLIPIVQAATLKRQIGVNIASIGQSGQAILLKTWNGQDCTVLTQHLHVLMTSLSQLEQQHLTYPMLHYFHGRRRSESLALGIAALDEALTILRYGLKNDCGIPFGIYDPARQVITKFLYTLKGNYIYPQQETPPTPQLKPLRSSGFPIVAEEEFRERLNRLSERRRLLLSLVRNEGWDWSQADPDPDASLSEETVG